MGKLHPAVIFDREFLSEKDALTRAVEESIVRLKASDEPCANQKDELLGFLWETI